jgi:hypothetical protein
MDVLVMLRHPAAFAGSLKAANWSHPFDHFLRQPLLMEHHLAPFRGEIEDFARRPKPIVDQAILLWNLIHSMILIYRAAHPDWLFVRHEDLSLSPLPGYEKIFQRLGLTLTRPVRRKIRASSESPNRRPGLQDTVRDSAANVYSWKDRLTTEEIRRIWHGTHDIAEALYPAETWVRNSSRGDAVAGDALAQEGFRRPDLGLLLGG